MPEQVAFFEKKIRPVLVDKCFKCHSARLPSSNVWLHQNSRRRKWTARTRELDRFQEQPADGEFGRTPTAQNGNGRDHNAKGYTTWMAGGGVKGGLRHLATDEYGFEAVEGKTHIHDWHATILHLLGLNHEKLTYNYAGREMKLTDVKGGSVVKEILL